MPRSALVLLVVAGVGCSASPRTGLSPLPEATGAAAAAGGEHEALLDSLDGYLRGQVQRGFSGVVLVARGDRILLRRAYSDDPRVTPESAFWIGSMTKQFAASAILRLQEQGALSVADPISKHVPGVPADKQHITIHHLLTHTSGLGNRYVADGIVDRDQAVRAILALPLESSPGTYAYSNDGYALLGVLISIVSGGPYEQYLREQLLFPAGMARSGFWGEPPAPGEAVLAPVRQARGPAMRVPNWGYRGTTGIRSTVEDLYRWHRALQGEGLLARSSMESMFAPHVQRSETQAYGYGWQVVRTGLGMRLLAHSGAESGLDHYASIRRYVDEDLVFVLLSNAEEEMTWDTQRESLQILFRQLYPERRPQ